MVRKIILFTLLFSLGFLTSQLFFAKSSVIGQTKEQEVSPSSSNTHVLSIQTDESILVTRVIDGDTTEEEGEKRARHIDMDPPERVDPRRRVECFGKEASVENKRLVEGKRVRLEKDISETDHYGRLLRYVYVDDVFVNDSLVREGFAQVSTFPPDVKYQDLFRQSEAEARAQNRGLWAGCPPENSTNTTNPTNELLNNKINTDITNQCTIKGNISTSGEKIYHLPGCGSYDKTVIDESVGERWFCTENEAKTAGWRKAKNC